MNIVNITIMMSRIVPIREHIIMSDSCLTVVSKRVRNDLNLFCCILECLYEFGQKIMLNFWKLDKSLFR